ncbi:hypothetical protein LTS18_014002, partial [Coniosporium uncinatum]
MPKENKRNIPGEEDDFTSVPSYQPAVTPRETLQRVTMLGAKYADLRTDMLDEVRRMETGIIEPAEQARKMIQPMKKVIKRREDRKLDYERYKGRVENSEKKTRRSDRENTAYVKHQGDLDRAIMEYQEADNHLKDTLPAVVAAAVSLLPHLLNTQIMIQNTLLAHIYTTLHDYSNQHGFQPPPPSHADVIAQWQAGFEPLRSDVETHCRMIAQGKAVQMPFKSQGHAAQQSQGKTMTGMNIRNGFAQRRSNSQGQFSSQPSKSQLSLSRTSTNDGPLALPSSYEEDEGPPPPKPPRPRAESRLSSFSASSPPPVDVGSKPRISSLPHGTISSAKPVGGSWQAKSRRPSSNLNPYGQQEFPQATDGASSSMHSRSPSIASSYAT